MTRTLLIIDAIVNALEVGTGRKVFRSYMEALESRDFPAIAVYPKDELSEEIMNERSRNTLRLIVEAVDAGSQSDTDALNPEGFPPDRVADKTRALAHRLVMADHRLHGLCHWVKYTGVEWDQARADNDIAAMRMGFEIEHDTKIYDLEEAA